MRQVLVATLQAEDADLIERCVDLKISGLVKWNAIHRRLNAVVEHAEEHVAPEAVQACLKSKAFRQRLSDAQQDPDGWVQRRLRRHQQVHRTLDVVEEMAAPTNKDKRTRTTNAHFRLGIAGITPQTQVQVGPDQNFMDFIQRMMTKRDAVNAAG